MKIEITVTRAFEMDEARVLNEPGFEPPSSDASPDELRSWLEESFYELCGFERDRDHVDGKFVWRVDESVDADFRWDAAAPALSEPRRNT